MNKETYCLLENFMLSCMEDAAHDKEHIYRVLYNALEIAKTEDKADLDILTAACLLHDIGRNDTTPSFFQEYKYKLENIYTNFYTEKAAAIAKERQRISTEFYNSLYQEVNSSYQNGINEVNNLFGS